MACSWSPLQYPHVTRRLCGLGLDHCPQSGTEFWVLTDASLDWEFPLGLQGSPGQKDSRTLQARHFKTESGGEGGTSIHESGRT